LAWTLLSGSRHESALARVAGRGAVVVSLLWRWEALAHLAVSPFVLLPAALALPQAAMVALVWIARPAGDGGEMAAKLGSTAAVGAILLGAATAVPAGVRLGWFAVSACTLLVFAARRWCERRAGGVSRDMLGVLEQAAECIILTGAACQSCSW
jgi:cobalamin synthase